MALVLSVPFNQKDKAKALGAKWSPALKKWYVVDKSQYHKFAEWVDGSLILTDHFYLVEGVHNCSRCNKNTVVIGFGFETFYALQDLNPDLTDTSIHIGQIDSKLPDQLELYLEQKYGFKQCYSKSLRMYFYANHCSHCSRLQSNYDLFDEVESPFFVDGTEAASKLILHKIKLPYDVAVSAEINYGSEDFLIKEYATLLDEGICWG